MIKLVIFDWNGTILADVVPILKAVNLFLSKIDGRRIDMKTYRDKTSVPVIDFYEKLGYDKESFLEKVEEHSKNFHTTYEALVTKSRTRSGTKQVLKHLKQKGIKLAIVSNHNVPKIKIQLERLKIDKYFDDIIANKDLVTAVKKRKKENWIKSYLILQKIKPQETILVGDAPEEAELGRALGITSVCITDGHYSTSRLKKAKPNFLISNLKNLIPIIADLA